MKRSRLRTAAIGWVVACGVFGGGFIVGGQGVAGADSGTDSSAAHDGGVAGSAGAGRQDGRAASTASTARGFNGEDRTGAGEEKPDRWDGVPTASAIRAPSLAQSQPPPPQTGPGVGVGSAKPLSASATGGAQGGISESGGVREYQFPLSPASPSVPGLPAEPTVIDAETGHLGGPTMEPPPITMPPVIGGPAVAEVPLRFPGSSGSNAMARSGEGSLQRERLPMTTQSGTNGVPESFRLGYPQYLREAKMGEVAVLALPGFAGLLALTALGGLLGYRQAKAGQVFRTTGTNRFLQ